MTKQRKLRLKSKIEESRARIMQNNPFLALLLMYLKFIADDNTEKISTNGRCIYFSPDYITKLTVDELDYILCHQVLHIILGHIWRHENYAGAEYHFSCDIQVNALLENYGFEKQKYPHFGRIYNTISYEYTTYDSIEFTVEEIYNKCPHNMAFYPEDRRKRFLPDDDFWWDEKYDDGIFGELILDIPKKDRLIREGSKSNSSNSGDNNQSGSNGQANDELQQEWQDRLNSLASHLTGAQTKKSGTIPEFMQRLVKNIREPVLDWKKILNDFLQEQICDYSFSPPDRRFSETEFFLPDFNGKEYISKDILFMVDTSGSVDDKELSKVYSEIKGAAEQFDGKLCGMLGFFDASVKEPLPFENINDLTSIIPYGGGGTDFTVIFDYIKKNYRSDLPACVVIFTDGDGPYPEESETMNLPVLWILNNAYRTPPFGKTIYLPTSI